MSGELFSVRLSERGYEERRDFVGAGLAVVPMGITTIGEQSIIYGTVGSRPLWMMHWQAPGKQVPKFPVLLRRPPVNQVLGGRYLLRGHLFNHKLAKLERILAKLRLAVIGL